MLDEIQKSLKSKGLLPLYCFYGDEPLLIDEAAQLIEAQALTGSDASFNRSVTTAKELKPIDLLALANSMPMFGDRRFIWVKEAQTYAAADLEALLPYVEKPNPRTTLLFSASKVDARLKFFKAFKKSGELTKFNRPYENQIPQWLQGQARSMELKLRGEAAQLLAELGGNDLMALKRMLEQLAIFVGGKGEVTLEHVEQVVARVKVNSIFELCDAIGERNADRALQILRNMLQNRVRGLQMLSLIVRHYRQLWQCKELVEARVPSAEIASKLGVHPYFVRGIVSQQKRFSVAEFERAFALLLRTDYLLKSSPLREEVIVERLVLQLLGRPL
ncbi:MAG: DNA polymerase III subunit delta [Myxococcales bacterium]|nr:DNA polymerase III subunit delta [Myxococcales bacterium]